MWKNVLPVYSARIRTHDLWNMSLIPITTGPGLPSNFDFVLSKDGLRKKRSHDNDEKIYSILKQPRFLMLLLDTVQLSETWVQQILPLFSAADKTLLHSIIPRASFCHCHKLVTRTRRHNSDVVTKPSWAQWKIPILYIWGKCRPDFWMFCAFNLSSPWSMRHGRYKESRPSLGKGMPRDLGRGQVVSVLNFYSDNTSSNPAEVFSVKPVFKWMEINEKEARVGSFKKRLLLGSWG